jgi:hypothetical protein
VARKWRTIRQDDQVTKAHRSEAATFRWLREDAPDGDYRIEVDEGAGRWHWFCDAAKTNGNTIID